MKIRRWRRSKCQNKSAFWYIFLRDGRLSYCNVEKNNNHATESRCHHIFPKLVFARTTHNQNPIIVKKHKKRHRICFPPWSPQIKIKFVSIPYRRGWISKKPSTSKVPEDLLSRSPPLLLSSHSPPSKKKKKKKNDKNTDAFRRNIVFIYYPVEMNK